jgi:hypothetical protein
MAMASTIAIGVVVVVVASDCGGTSTDLIPAILVLLLLVPGPSLLLLLLLVRLLLSVDSQRSTASLGGFLSMLGFLELSRFALGCAVNTDKESHGGPEDNLSQHCFPTVWWLYESITDISGLLFICMFQKKLQVCFGVIFNISKLSTACLCIK